MPSSTSPNLDNPGPRKMSDPHDASAAAGASEERPAQASDFYRAQSREWLIAEHQRLVTKKFEERPPSLSEIDDLRLACVRLALDVDELDALTPPPHVAGTDARETTRELSEAELIERLFAALKAHEAWEADIVLRADWSGSCPKLTQEQMDALTPVQDQRNAAFALVAGYRRAKS